MAAKYFEHTLANQSVMFYALHVLKQETTH